MEFPLFDLDLARSLRVSKVRIGPLRVQGVPAILLGAASIVIAAGAMRVLSQGAPNLPESIRELRALLESSRRDPKKLTP